MSLNAGDVGEIAGMLGDGGDGCIDELRVSLVGGGVVVMAIESTDGLSSFFDCGSVPSAVEWTEADS